VLLASDHSQHSSFVAGFRPFRFVDGWGIVTPTADHDFAGMCKALDVDGYDDPRVATIGQRVQHRELVSELVDMCYAHAVEFTMDEISARFDAERVPYSMILSPAELVDDAHAKAVGLFEYHDHHVVGSARLPRHPTRFNGTPAQLRLGSPALGEHTDEILTEIGLRERIAELREAGTVA